MWLVAVIMTNMKWVTELTYARTTEPLRNVNTDKMVPAAECGTTFSAGHYSL